MKNCVYAIAGPSGVGKSTVSKILAACLGYSDTTIISSDDSHKWPRGDENWKFFTHLNPDSNNLEQELRHIGLLKAGKKIERKLYDHTTGHHTAPVSIEPTKNIIYEGLHTMYGTLSSLSDVSFYIDVEDVLKREWKILRDSKKRGYSIDEVIKVIDRRKVDEKLYIIPQKEKCDVIIKFTKSTKGNILIDFEYKNPDLAGLINDMKNLYGLLQDFIMVSMMVAQNPQLAQNKGGNMSFKFKDVIVITESGGCFENVSYFDGFGFYGLDGKSIFKNQKRPSMEIGCHLKLGPCCLHTHPLHLMAVICSEECDKILNDIFDDICIVDYATPGAETRDALKYHKNVIVKNHGLFVSRQSLSECLQFSLKVDRLCKQYLQRRTPRPRFLYPDAFVLADDNNLYHSYVQGLIERANLTQKPLSYEQVLKLEGMEEENYRKQTP